MLAALKEEESVTREVLTALNLEIDAATQELASLQAELVATNRELHEMTLQRHRLVIEAPPSEKPTARVEAHGLAHPQAPRAQARNAVERARSLVSWARACRLRADALLGTCRTLRHHDE